MTTRGKLPPGWQKKDVAAFISAVDSAGQEVRGLEKSRSKPKVYGLLVSVASAKAAERKSADDFGQRLKVAQRSAMAAVHKQPLWKVIDRDPNFQELRKRLAVKIAADRFYDQLTVLRAVALGGMISIAPPKRADARTRVRAAGYANKLIEFRKLGVSLEDYADDWTLWRLLDDLIREMKSKKLKSRMDDWSGSRAARHYFAFELFKLIGPNNVTGGMLVAYAAMLGDKTGDREIQRHLKKDKSDYRPSVGEVS